MKPPCISAIVLLLFVNPSDAATNEWTKATSGYWEENYWSLAQLPSMQHEAIAFRNPGFKALAIGGNTTANFPSSLSIRNLIVDGPANLLLLNYAGLQVPLSIAEDFTLGPAASLLSYYSVLSASNFLSSGRVTFSEGSVANFYTFRLGVNAPAELNISNAVVSSRGLFLGDGVSATVNQFGGTNRMTEYDWLSGLRIGYSSVYNLHNGMLLTSFVEMFGAQPQIAISGGSMEVQGHATFYGGSVLLQGGSLRIRENVSLNTQFTQTAGVNVLEGQLQMPVSQNGDARYVLSGGTLSSAYMTLGGASDGRATFEQSGAVHTNSGYIYLWGDERTQQHHVEGAYYLSAGLLAADEVNVFGGIFNQSGGTNRIRQLVLDDYGGFVLRGGSLNSSNVTLRAEQGSLPYDVPTFFQQSNGVHTVEDQLLIAKSTSSFLPRGGIYRLDAGTLISQMVDVRDQFAQTGGAHTNRQYISIGGGRYTLGGGYLVSPVLNIYNSYFTQTGGTNHAAGVGLLGKSTFYLGGGTLSTVNVRVGSSDVSGRDGRSWFVHSNGNHFVSNALAIDPGFYRLDAGNLVAPNIGIFPDSELWLNGGSISNPGTLTMYDGKILAQGAHQLGKLVVATGPLPFFNDSDPFSTLDLQTGSTMIRFQDSRDRAAEWNGRLIIRNWTGATNGGGTDRVYVGTTAQGLTAAQLGRIIFENPAGLPVGSYPARILSTGEIVPSARPAMMFSRSANRLVISWSGDYWLLTATNVAGPYETIFSATSPYTNLFVGPQRYFQLRSPGYWP